MSVRILKTLAVVVVSAAVVGCGGNQGKLAVANPLQTINQGKLAVANPLQVLSDEVTKQTPGVQLDKSRIDNGFLVLDGDHGEALNLATRLHRRLIELNIPNEIRYQLKLQPGPAQLQISFPTKLTGDQKRSLAHALQSIDNAV